MIVMKLGLHVDVIFERFDAHLLCLNSNNAFSPTPVESFLSFQIKRQKL